MSRRVSHRLAAKDADPDKENHSGQVSSPPVTPATVKPKAAGNKKVSPVEQSLTGKSDIKTTTDQPLTPKSVIKSTPSMVKTEVRTATDKVVKQEKAKTPANIGTKRKRAPPESKDEDEDQLPHNMGKRIAVKPNIKQGGAEESKPAPPKTRPLKNVKKEEQLQDAKEIIESNKALPKKKAEKANPYGLTPGETPFPDWPHPTAKEAHIIHDLLMSTIEPARKKKFVPPNNIPPPSEVVAGCGEVPSILDALIRTLLSAATSAGNSSASFQGLVERFGLATVGVGKGSVNWNAVHEASVEDIFKAIECGGLAKNKSQNIKKILAIVDAENKERLATLLKAEEGGDAVDADEGKKAERALDLRALQQGVLTLDYYHHLEKDAAITTFTNYPGIGVKTAACVNLFCMQRPCFAVDTHVFRLCKYLGWVPPDETRVKNRKKADRNTTFSHCEVRIPDELKYGLHALFLEHGKNCPRCRAITGETSEGWADANCVIEHLVKRLGAKKGGVDSPKKASKAKKSKKQSSSDGETTDQEEARDEESPKSTKRSTRDAKKIGTRTGNTTPPSTTPTPKKSTSSRKATKPAAVTKTGRVTKSKPAKGKMVGKGKKSEKVTEESDGEESSELSDLTDEAEL